VIKLGRKAPWQHRKIRVPLLIWSLSGVLIACGAGFSRAAYGLPTQGVVSNGSASVATDGSQLSIRQVTPSVVIDWKTFSVGAGETVQFFQPNPMAMAINRIFGGEPSVIAGQIAANGRVVLINSSGILFSSTSRVDVGGLIASTLNFSNGDLSGGSLLFEGNSAAAVINRGKINLQDGGALAFVGPQVRNFGEINAPSGQVALLAGNRVRLETGGPFAFEIGQGAIDALIEQGGIVRAPGGRIYLAARTLNEITKSVVNVSGLTEGSMARVEDGIVILDAAPTVQGASVVGSASGSMVGVAVGKAGPPQESGTPPSAGVGTAPPAAGGTGGTAPPATGGTNPAAASGAGGTAPPATGGTNPPAA
jgi:filamentous hemagglutinin family protein